MTKKFSILIPAYNAQKYIDKCLTSIISQTFKNFEVIIIDDGSHDKTFEVCQEYANKDNRFKIYHQENSGVIVTRNKLLSLANGEWIVFIDADDYVDSTYLANFHEGIIKHPQTDVVVCDYIRVEKHNRTQTIRKPFKNKEDYLKKLLGWRTINTVLWAKAIKNKLIIDRKIKFENNIHLGEDLCFISRLFYYANDITYIPYAKYYWNRANANSLSLSTALLNNYIPLYKTIKDFYKNQSDYKLYAATIDNTIVRVIQELFLAKIGDLDTSTFSIDESLLTIINKIRLNCIKRNCYWLIILSEKIERNLKKIHNKLFIR
ncbi:glycosyltransferase family 2 protein [Bacteroides gallinaceum]|uniref:Glycosyltransferase family A protein n=1 Tax=Bacteroides gallinaceum TaxID=1462571 RepID=A0ABT7VIJ8_9BACE|nr:glycosyltransferase family A protein [Bacteroides gallinaceum]MDM8326137.1 glycosyltransferase family A protein [Bacteroides gallinaceum]